MKKIIFIIFLSLNLFALSPFSLESVKEVNIKLADKSGLLSKEFKSKIKSKLISELNKVGVKTETEQYSNFVIKIESVKIENSYAIDITLLIIEDVALLRDEKIEKMGITYYKNDFFDTTKDSLEKDVYESIIDFLLFDLLEQYKDEN